MRILRSHLASFRIRLFLIFILAYNPSQPPPEWRTLLQPIVVDSVEVSVVAVAAEAVATAAAGAVGAAAEVAVGAARRRKSGSR